MQVNYNSKNIGNSSSAYDPDIGVSNPNLMRDKRILELKAKHNFYVMPTFNQNHLRLNTRKYQNEFDNDTLTLYSGGGYIAKSRLASSHSKRKRTAFGSKKSANYKYKRVPKRFNEELDAVSQKSVSKRRALSRGLAATRSVHVPYQQRPMTGKSSKIDQESVKDQLINQIERMSKDEVEKMSRKIDEITKDGDHEYQQADNYPMNNDLPQGDPEFEREQYNTLDVEMPPEATPEPAPENFNMEESKDYVDELPPTITPKNNGVFYTPQDKKRPKSNYSRSSRRSGKSYILSLKKELDQERSERYKLEQEIEQLKKISSEISSKLGLNKE